VAKALNLTKRTIANMETGKHNPAPETCEKLCRFLGMTLRELRDYQTLADN
jgi:DNA-binding XRE family transcriptional regulator